jgi:2-dehydro-3-deoxyphosphooctonate aldolase (KDO 8-P synthase)
LDVIQIPAFLCRQTDFVLEAAKTGKALNLKKAQFMAPQDMEHVVQKAASCGNRKIFLTERGSFFGYHNLVVDFRSLAIMAGLGYPVVFDATHSVQLPSHQGACSGGERQYVHGLSLAAVAFGSRGLFLEVHDRPDVAPCDGPNMIDLRGLEMLLARAKRVEEALR